MAGKDNRPMLSSQFTKQERLFKDAQKKADAAAKIFIIIGLLLLGWSLHIVNKISEMPGTEIPKQVLCPTCRDILHARYIIAIIIVSACIICLILASKQLSTAASFEKQLLKLNDLKIAAELLTGLSEERCPEDKAVKPSEKDKATQQVITGLLNSYTG